MVAMEMSLSDRLSLAGLGTTGSSISNLDILVMVPFWKGWRKHDWMLVCWEGAEPGTDLEGERLQDVSLDGGGQQDDGRLGVILVPVDVDALTLQQLEAALVWKDLNSNNQRRSAPGGTVQQKCVWKSEIKTLCKQQREKS